MAGAHAPLAPSAAARWVRCALSVSLEAAFPETEESPESLEGSAAHWVNQMLLQGTPAALGTQAPNGVVVTQEMLEGAEMVRDDIAATLGPDWAKYVVVEQRVQIPLVHPTHNWGTPDYRAWSRLPDGRLCLHVWDYKFGHGIVEAFENWQLIDYSIGLLTEAGASGLLTLETAVDLRVIQPRAFHRQGPVRSWRVRAEDLVPYLERLKAAAAEATGPNPSATPDPDACEHCLGRHACEALQRAAYVAADKGRQYGRLDLSPHALGLEQRALVRARALLDARISGNEAQIVAEIKRGALVPFWMMESVPGRLAWTKPPSEIFALGEMLELDLKKEAEPITPTQAKAAAKAKAKAQGLDGKTYDALIDAYASRPTGAAKLVADDGTKARLTFTLS
jgi:hypothetical protein